MVAREYAQLAERCDAAGMKCSSIETQGAGGGRPGDREAAIFRDIERLRVLRRRIGDGLAREVSRNRPSATGGPRSAIRVRRLVDDVTLNGLTLDQVFDRCGWRNVNAKMRGELRGALCGALDRMRGFDLARPQDAA
ncbi:hypothetical protein RISW2_18895 [Roseivivax isoporae LMG 25204]|uniref:Uncharacterized protein n=1 Tax=Roseivivax isoporae LMG 25204 TaxID=1449351 RepID=X7F253_9RHOB|nr:hypothetical protein RISW2_18895 [Roseivivax isoporae LMG 25204]